MKAFLFILIILLSLKKSLSAQCPDRDFLWHRIIYLRDSSKVPFNQQKEELMKYLNKIKDCSYKNDSTNALLLQRIGWLYSLQKDYITAIKLTRESLEIIYKNLGKSSINYGHVVKTYNNLRLMYDSIGEHQLSQQAMDSCVFIALKIYKKDPHYLLPTKTYDLLLAGDYYKCIEFASIGEILARSDQGYRFYLPYYLIWKINALLFLNKFNEAEQVLKKSIVDFSKPETKNFLGTFYGLLARLNEEKKDEKKSLLYLKKCVLINEKAKQLVVCAQAINNIGYDLYFKKLKNYKLALFYYFQALKYADSSEALNIYENIANVYVQRKMFDSSFYFFQKSFDQIKIKMNEFILLKEAEKYVINNGIEYVEYLTNLVLDKADAFLEFYKSTKDRGILNKAIASYKIIDQLFDKIKKSQDDIQTKLFWREHNRRLYENAIEASFLGSSPAEAFYFFEKSRAVILNDQLNEETKVKEGDILKLSQLKKRIMLSKDELDSKEVFSEQYKKLQNETLLTEVELSKLEEATKKNNPLYYQSFFDTSFVTLKNIQEGLLKDHQALIELFDGDSSAYVLILTSKKNYFTKINKILFDSLSSAYSLYISQPGYLNKNYNTFINTSHQLYELLFQNIQLPAGRTIISPDGKYFPFEALATATQPLTYFLENHAVSYTYSARYLLNNFSSNSANVKSFAGMAPVKYSNGLPSLSGSDQSLKKIQGYFSNSTSFIGNNASKNNFLNEFYKYKIIQLYTHATDNGATKEPMIYFSDSALSLSDLLPEKKPVTNLIVLSACQTASGKSYSGEGVFSFNRGFASVGIPTCVSNLWQVDNQSTYKITELFYKNISDGMPLDIALQNAKKEFIKNASSTENKLPYYWASSILVGKTDALSLQKKSSDPWVFISVVLIMLILAGWAVNRKTNSNF